MTRISAASFPHGWSPVPLRRPRLADLPAIAGGVSAATGLIALVGWTFHATLMTTVVPRAVAMKPNTALALVLIGVGLAIISGRSVARGDGASGSGSSSPQPRSGWRPPWNT